MAKASHHRALETQLDNETVRRQTITFTMLPTHSPALAAATPKAPCVHISKGGSTTVFLLSTELAEHTRRFAGARTSLATVSGNEAGAPGKSGGKAGKRKMALADRAGPVESGMVRKAVINYHACDLHEGQEALTHPCS